MHYTAAPSLWFIHLYLRLSHLYLILTLTLTFILILTFRHLFIVTLSFIFNLLDLFLAYNLTLLVSSFLASRLYNLRSYLLLCYA